MILFGGGKLTSTEKSILGKSGVQRTHCVSGDDAMLQFLYQRAHCLIFPSLWEGFGLPVLEAMSLGCPVICSEISVFKELFGDAVKYFDPYSVLSLSSAFESLNTNHEEMRNLVKRGFEVNKSYSWLKTSQIIQSAYYDLLKAR